jgi:hypothetical protein
MTPSARKAALIALAITAVVTAGCQDATEPVVPGPRFHVPGPPAEGYYQLCRRWPQGGTAIRWTDTLQFLVNPCAVQVSSSPGTMMSGTNPQTMTFQFTGPVVTVAIQARGTLTPCPTVPVMVTAYNGEMLVDSGPISPNCDGDWHVAGPITKLVVTPPSPMPPNGVLFEIHYYVPCPPTEDPVLDDLDVRAGLKNELSLSRPNWATGANRKERRGFIFRRDDGTYFLEPLADPNATMCETGIPGLPAVPVIPGATFVGEYHTHTSKHRERLTGCRGQKPGEDRRANRKARSGGGSDADWNYATVRQKSMYVIDYDHKVSRLDPDTFEGSPRRNNPNQWKFPDATNNCLEQA